MTKLPNFFIVGAAKAGTTSIFEYLSQHPDIFFPDLKEPSFFAFADQNLKFKSGSTRQIVTKFDQYTKLFQNAGDQSVRGDASTPYLYFYERTIANIKKYVPDSEDAKILILLRNPIDRAFSNYMMRVRNVKEGLSFEQALEVENQRINENYHFDFHYLKRSMYYEQVKTYLDSFPNVKVVFFEDLADDPKKIVYEVMDFLHLKNGVSFNLDQVYNISGAPKSKLLNRIVFPDNTIKRVIGPIVPKSLKNKVKNAVSKYNMYKLPIQEETRGRLIEFFKEDVNRLSDLLQKDLSHWVGN